jgi:hypothetical protein
MTNDELFARQIHNLQRVTHNIAISLRKHLMQTPQPPGAAPGVNPDIAELDLMMQSFHDTITGLTAQVQKANSRSNLILPQ